MTQGQQETIAALRAENERLKKSAAISEQFQRDFERSASEASRLRFQLEEAVGALESLKWKSVDKDNMEFACRITYSQMDKIKAALANVGRGNEP